MNEKELRETIDELALIKNQTMILISLLSTFRSCRLISEDEEDLKGLKATGNFCYILEECLNYVSETRNSSIQKLSELTKRLHYVSAKQE
jgi:hypothetical protein